MISARFEADLIEAAQVGDEVARVEVGSLAAGDGLGGPTFLEERLGDVAVACADEGGALAGEGVAFSLNSELVARYCRFSFARAF